MRGRHPLSVNGGTAHRQQAHRRSSNSGPAVCNPPIARPTHGRQSPHAPPQTHSSNRAIDQTTGERGAALAWPPASARRGPSAARGVSHATDIKQRASTGQSLKPTSHSHAPKQQLARPPPPRPPPRPRGWRASPSSATRACPGRSRASRCVFCERVCVGDDTIRAPAPCPRGSYVNYLRSVDAYSIGTIIHAPLPFRSRRTT